MRAIWRVILAAVTIWLVCLPAGAAAQTAMVSGGVELRAFASLAGLGGGRSGRLMDMRPGGRLTGGARPLSDQGRRERDDFVTASTRRDSGSVSDSVARMSAATGGPAWRCLTEAIYFEARGEPADGQAGVGEVVLNRVDAPNYPDNVCDVVNQGTGRRDACQFSYTCDGIPEVIDDAFSWDRAGKIARRLLDGAPRRLTGRATHYHADYVDPNWAHVYPQTARLGRHLFYRQIPGA